MSLSKPIRSVYLIGIAGTGMGAFAGLLKQAGYEVKGSDSVIYPPMSTKLAEWGIEVKAPYGVDNLKAENPDLVIVGNVVSKTNVEVEAVLQRGLSYWSFPQALSELFLKDQKSVVVAGTHGKTTSSALLAHTLTHAGKDPGFLIGGIPQNFSESFHHRSQSGGLFVVEGDEYDTAYFDKGPKFLHYRPHYLLCTSLEYDHADIYVNIEQIVDRFAELAALVPKEGTIVAFSRAPWLSKALAKSALQAKLISYGPGGDYEAKRIQENAQGISFEVFDNQKSKTLGTLSLPLSGLHNVENALGCYALLLAAGLSHDEISAGYKAFKGVKRRLEEIGEEKGILVVDDFAHHPTAVEQTLAGARKRYAPRPLWALFEPRSASSCRNVFHDAYAKSFSSADRVLLAPPGRELDKSIALDVNQLAKDIQKQGVQAEAFASYDAMIDVVLKEVPKNAVLLCMSNGGFGNIHKRILEALVFRPQ